MCSKRVKRNIDFIEKLTVPSGVGQGRSLNLRPWEKRFINDVYGPSRKGRRIVRRAILSVARKNGKTTLIAALVLLHLIGPEQELNGEIYSAANERDQAAIVFKVCAQMIRLEPELGGLLKIVESTKTIVNYHNGSVYRAISAEAGSKYGFNPTVVIYDELAQAKSRDLYDALDTSMGAREEPLFLVISTQSHDPQHILSQLIDDGLCAHDPTTIVHLYAVPEDIDAKLYCEKCHLQTKAPQGKRQIDCPKCEGPLIAAIFDPKIWKMANPALGDFRDLEDFKALAARARRMPGFEAAFRNLYLNMRADATSPLIPRAEWMACQGDKPILAGEKIYLGLDLSATTDLCALVAVSAEDGDRVRAWFWKPGDLIHEHEKRDRAPYRAWVREGYIAAPPGRAIDYGHVAQKLAMLNANYRIIGLAYDRWRMDTLLKEMAAIGLDCYLDGKDAALPGALRLVPWGQGFKDMAPAIDALENSILERKFCHGGNPVLTWCISNAMAVSDPAGNRKLDKSKTRFRIDGAVATAMAIGLKKRDGFPEEPAASFWEA